MTASTTPRTPAEADRMLPLLRRLVLVGRAHAKLIGRRRAAGPQDDSADEVRKHSSGLRYLEAELQRARNEIESLGCRLVDAESGLVACRSQVEGHPAFITWRPGQLAFSEWYGEAESPDLRRPLLRAACAPGS